MVKVGANMMTVLLEYIATLNIIKIISTKTNTPGVKKVAAKN